MRKEKLIIFVKNEVAGKVKTRLAETIGDDEALKVYQKLIRYTHSVTTSLNVNKEVWYSSYIDKDDVWDNDKYEKKQQQGDDLGKRMSHAFRSAFENGAPKVVIIGSDCAEITSELIEDAFKRLDDSDLVIGPAEDGGYYLLGMNRYHPQIFKGVEWSTGEVLKSTIRIIEQCGRSYTLLSSLNDIDTIEDWREAKDDILKNTRDHV